MRKCKWCGSTNVSTKPKIYKDGSAHIALGCDDCGKHIQCINEAKEAKKGNARIRVEDTRQKIVIELGYDSFEAYQESDKWDEIVDRVLERDNHKCKFCRARGCKIVFSIYTPGNMVGRTLDGIFSVCEYCHYRLYNHKEGRRSLYKQMQFLIQCLKRGSV